LSDVPGTDNHAPAQKNRTKIIITIAIIIAVAVPLALYAGSLAQQKPASTSSNIQTTSNPVALSSTPVTKVPEAIDFPAPVMPDINNLTRHGDYIPPMTNSQIYGMLHQPPYVNKDYGFQIDYPAQITPEEDQPIGMSTAIMSITDHWEGSDAPQYNYSAKWFFAITTANMGGHTLQEFANTTKAGLDVYLSGNNALITHSADASVRGKYPAYVIDFISTSQGQTAKARLIIVQHGEQAYILIFAAIPTKAFDQEEALFNAMIGTFAFMDGNNTIQQATPSESSHAKVTAMSLYANDTSTQFGTVILSNVDGAADSIQKISFANIGDASNISPSLVPANASSFTVTYELTNSTSLSPGQQVTALIKMQSGLTITQSLTVSS
jgi:hypothetical protein